MTDRARVEFDHNRLLKKVANEVFQPLGLVQRGSSRVWFDDHGWWVIMLAFEPSGFGKGSYLRVASSPLWGVTDSVGFAHEYRDTWDHPHANFGMRFIRARRPDWWERDVRILSERAVDYVRELRAAPHDVRGLLDLAIRQSEGSVKGKLGVGFPAGLLGLDDLAREGLADLDRLLIPDEYTHASSRAAWDDWVQQRLADLQRAVGDRRAFARLVADNVARSRASEQLPALSIDQIVQDLEAAA